MRKNMAERDRPQMTIWCMRFACFISKATDTHSEHVIIIAFSRQQWLHERAVLLRNTCFTCLLHFMCTLIVYVVLNRGALLLLFGRGNNGEYSEGTH
jgi:hypothetical protein